MTNRWDDWKAQEPPPDFAARTVAAALAERAQRGRARRLAGRRAAVACAMAAVMVAGVAWGAWKARVVSEQRRSEPPVVVTEGSTSVATVPVPPLAPFVPASIEPSASPPNAVPPPVRKRTDAASMPDAGRKVMRPPCECSPHEEMCTCF